MFQYDKYSWISNKQAEVLKALEQRLSEVLNSDNKIFVVDSRSEDTKDLNVFIDGLLTFVDQTSSPYKGEQAIVMMAGITYNYILLGKVLAKYSDEMIYHKMDTILIHWYDRKPGILPNFHMEINFDPNLVYGRKTWRYQDYCITTKFCKISEDYFEYLSNKSPAIAVKEILEKNIVDFRTLLIDDGFKEYNGSEDDSTLYKVFEEIIKRLIKRMGY